MMTEKVRSASCLCVMKRKTVNRNPLRVKIFLLLLLQVCRWYVDKVHATTRNRKSLCASKGKNGTAAAALWRMCFALSPRFVMRHEEQDFADAAETIFQRGEGEEGQLGATLQRQNGQQPPAPRGTVWVCLQRHGDGVSCF